MPFNTAKNRWWLFIVLIVVQTLNFGIDFYSLIDRRALRSLVEARQKIGLVLIKANERTFSAEEKRIICENWTAAAYPEGEEKERICR